MHNIDILISINSKLEKPSILHTKSSVFLLSSPFTAIMHIISKILTFDMILCYMVQKHFRQFVFYLLKHKGSMETNSEVDHDIDSLQENERLNQCKSSPNSPQKENEQSRLTPIAIVVASLIGITLLFLSAMTMNQPQNVAKQTPKEVRISLLTTQPFPKILWILCGEGGLDGLPMMEAVTARHQISIAEQSGYEVRVVDVINAYDWLTPQTTEMIRTAKHNTQYHIPVAELLRMGLLMEHGGVSAQLHSIIFAQRLDWIEKAFNYDGETLKHLQDTGVIRSCSTKDSPQVLLFAQGGHNMKWFDVKLLIAKPGSKLLTQAFKQMIKVLTHSRRAYDAFQNFGWYNNDKTLTMENFLYNLLSFRNHYWNTGKQFCRQYKVLQINRRQGSFMKTLYIWPRIIDFLQKDRNVLFQQWGKTKVLNVDMQAMVPHVMQAARFQSLGDAHNNSFFKEILKAQGNNWLLKPINYVRQKVRLCIVSLKPLPSNIYKEKIQQSLNVFLKDPFKDWQAIFFAEGIGQNYIEYSAEPSVKVVNSSEWQGLNLQRAATRYCDPSAIAVILDYDESFGSDDALSKIAETFTDKRVFAAFLSIKIGDKMTQPKSDRIFRTKITAQRVQNINEIASHLRAFSIYSYRLVAQFDLHDAWGRYFNRQIPLNTVLQLQNTENKRCEQAYMKFHVKRTESHGKQLPRIRIYLQKLFVNMASQRKIDRDLPEYAGKHDAHEWCEALQQYYERIKGPLDGFFVLNNGTEFQGLQNRRNLPKLIPNKIHQVWIGRVQLPAFKKLMIDHIKSLYPDWQHHLWTNQDITRQNFPLTYDLIQVLMEFDKRSPSDKMAMISDIMRLEILYRQGGFYFDTNYYIFRSEILEDWRTFEQVFIGQLVPFYKFQRQNSLMACVPGSQRFLRLLDHRRFSSRNLFSRWANMETGPAYVTFAVQGQEEMSPNLYQPGYEWVYPWYYNANNPNLCQATIDAPEDELLFKQKNAYWKNCSQVYKGSFGIQFFLEGGSWMVDRT